MQAFTIKAQIRIGEFKVATLKRKAQNDCLLGSMDSRSEVLVNEVLKGRFKQSSLHVNAKFHSLELFGDAMRCD